MRITFVTLFCLLSNFFLNANASELVDAPCGTVIITVNVADDPPLEKLADIGDNFNLPGDQAEISLRQAIEIAKAGCGTDDVLIQVDWTNIVFSNYFMLSAPSGTGATDPRVLGNLYAEDYSDENAAWHAGTFMVTNSNGFTGRLIIDLGGINHSVLMKHDQNFMYINGPSFEMRNGSVAEGIGLDFDHLFLFESSNDRLDNVDYDFILDNFITKATGSESQPIEYDSEYKLLLALGAEAPQDSDGRRDFLIKDCVFDATRGMEIQGNYRLEIDNSRFESVAEPDFNFSFQNTGTIQPVVVIENCLFTERNATTGPGDSRLMDVNNPNHFRFTGNVVTSYRSNFLFVTDANGDPMDQDVYINENSFLTLQASATPIVNYDAPLGAGPEVVYFDRDFQEMTVYYRFPVAGVDLSGMNISVQLFKCRDNGEIQLANRLKNVDVTSWWDYSSQDQMFNVPGISSSALLGWDYVRAVLIVEDPTNPQNSVYYTTEFGALFDKNALCTEQQTFNYFSDLVSPDLGSSNTLPVNLEVQLNDAPTEAGVAQRVYWEVAVAQDETLLLPDWSGAQQYALEQSFTTGQMVSVSSNQFGLLDNLESGDMVFWRAGYRYQADNPDPIIHWGPVHSFRVEVPDNDVIPINTYLTQFRNSHEAANWEYVVNYSDNTLSEGMVYSDGLGQARQRQVRDNEFNNIVTAESVYSETGRSSPVQTLPAPTDAAQFEYDTDFFDVMDGGQAVDFSARFFDLTDQPAPTFNPTDPNVLNLHRYYSSQSPDPLVDDALGYPYNFSRLEENPLGRIKQGPGGVGETFMADIGQNGYRYFYEKASKEELVRLFGSEAPDYTKVKKIRIYDPNGVAQVSYQDMNGNVIATAMAQCGVNDAMELIAMQKQPDGSGEPYYPGQSADFETVIRPLEYDQETENGFRRITETQFHIPCGVSGLSLDYTLTLSDFSFGDLPCATCSYNLTVELINLETGQSIPLEIDGQPAGVPYSIAPEDCTIPGNEKEVVVSLASGANVGPLPAEFKIRRVLEPYETSGENYLTDYNTWEEQIMHPDNRDNLFDEFAAENLTYTAFFALRERETRVMNAGDVPDICYQTNTVLGDGENCSQTGPLNHASFQFPVAVIGTPAAHEYFVLDRFAGVLFRADAVEMEIVAGDNCNLNTHDGVGTAAGFGDAIAMVRDQTNPEIIWVLENQPNGACTGCYLRKVNVVTGEVLTPTVANTGLKRPRFLETDAEGNLYVLHDFGNKIRKYTDPVNNPAQYSELNIPQDIVFGAITVANGLIYAVGSQSRKIYIIDPADPANPVHIAGTGNAGYLDSETGTDAEFYDINAIDVDPGGRYMYLSDRGNYLIRRIDLESAGYEVTTVAGTHMVNGYADGSSDPLGAGKAKFNNTFHIYCAPDGSILVADLNNRRIRAITPTTCEVEANGCPYADNCLVREDYLDQVDFLEINPATDSYRLVELDGRMEGDPDFREQYLVKTDLMETPAGQVEIDDFVAAYFKTNNVQLDPATVQLSRVSLNAGGEVTDQVDLLDELHYLKPSEPDGPLTIYKAVIPYLDCETVCAEAAQFSETEEEAEAECQSYYDDLVMGMDEVKREMQESPNTYDGQNLLDWVLNNQPLTAAQVAQLTEADLVLFQNYSSSSLLLTSFSMAECTERAMGNINNSCESCFNAFRAGLFFRISELLDTRDEFLLFWEETDSGLGAWPFSSAQIEDPDEAKPHIDLINRLGEDWAWFIYDNRVAFQATLYNDWLETADAVEVKKALQQYTTDDNNCEVNYLDFIAGIDPTVLGAFPRLLLYSDPVNGGLGDDKSTGLLMSILGDNELEGMQGCLDLVRSPSGGWNELCTHLIEECESIHGTSGCPTDPTDCPEVIEQHKRRLINGEILRYIQAGYSLTNDQSVALEDAIYNDLELDENQNPRNYTYMEYLQYLQEVAQFRMCVFNCEEGIERRFEDWIETKLHNERKDYVQAWQETCMANVSEDMTIRYTETLLHHTLYYYDKAGRLLRTIPPEGIDYAGATETTLPNHRMATEYEYSEDQVVAQSTPDGGTVRYIYDWAGRIRFSQTAEQAARSGDDGLVFTYTKYDHLSRIVEVGEYTDPDISAWPGPLESHAEQVPGYPEDRNYVTDNSWVRTVYNTSTFTFDKFPQSNTSGRVAAVVNSYGSTHFSYDVQGRVNRVLHAINDLGDNKYKWVEYQYSKFTGKVNQVIYMRDAPTEEFRHRFTYDANDRLVLVEISEDRYTWLTAARYQYYNHGPLRTRILGDGAQKLDYIYNINGWLKAINDPLNPENNALAQTAPDVFAELMHYHSGDYNRELALERPHVQANSEMDRTGGDLFNGNIRATTTWTAFHEVDFSAPQLLGQAYRYDVLNRLTGTYAEELSFDGTGSHPNFDGTNTLGIRNSDYAVNVAYDANGNIVSLQRNGRFLLNQVGGELGLGTGINQLDDLRYTYNGNDPLLPKSNNQLMAVSDVSSELPAQGDFEGSASYSYDANGRLSQDLHSNIRSIQWNIFNKPVFIQGTEGNRDMGFGYSPAGNQRLFKKVRHADASEADYDIFYVYGADNQLMATYRQELKEDPASGETVYDLFTEDFFIYGSAREGSKHLTKRVETPTALPDGISIPVSSLQLVDTTMDKIPVGISSFTERINELATVHYTTSVNDSLVAHVSDLVTRDLQRWLTQQELFLYTEAAGEWATFGPWVRAMTDGTPPQIGYNLFADLEPWLNNFLTNPDDPVETYLTQQFIAHGITAVGAIEAIEGFGAGVYTNFNQMLLQQQLTPDNRVEIAQQIALFSDSLVPATLEAELEVHFQDMFVNDAAALVNEVLTGSVEESVHTLTRSSTYFNLLRNVLTRDVVFKAGVMADCRLYEEAKAQEPHLPLDPVYNIVGLEEITLFPPNDPDNGVSAPEIISTLFGDNPNQSVIMAEIGNQCLRFDTASYTRMLREIEEAVVGGGSDSLLQEVLTIADNAGKTVEEVEADVRAIADGAITTAISVLNEILEEIPDYPDAEVLVEEVLEAIEGFDPGGLLPDRPEDRVTYDEAIVYEIGDHLGNVRAVVKHNREDDGTADVVSLSDYFPFGSLMPGRHYAANEYRYGFNGQEQDDEIAGVGNHNTALFWEYDPRIGRRWELDPLMVEWESPYATYRNNPLVFNDKNGDCPDCDDDKPDAEAGDIYQPEGADHQYIKGEDGEWTMLANLPGFEITNEPITEPEGTGNGQDLQNLQEMEAQFNVRQVIAHLNKEQIQWLMSNDSPLDLEQKREVMKIWVGTSGQRFYEDPAGGLFIDFVLGGMTLPFSAVSRAPSLSMRQGNTVIRTVAAKTSNLLKPLGLGSTGRTTAANLTEQLAMKEIMSNPTAGQIIKKSLSDPRWQGWSKMTNKTAHGVEIHYNALWENGVIKAIDDFKFITP